MKKNSILCVVFAAHALLCHAQSGNGTILGKVVDAHQRAVRAASIILKRQADSQLVKTAIADSLGGFMIDHLPKDTFALSVSCIGYRAYKSSALVVGRDSPFVLRLDIQLEQNDPTLLEKATVVNTKRFLELKIDRTVVNVGAFIGNIGSNALDVLEKSPGVRVDNYGGISLQSRGVTILLDGRQTYLAGSDLLNYLRSLPAEVLEKIELMPVPPAKYDAAGSGGIINIITKKTSRRGFNGSVTGNYGQGVYEKIDGSYYINYRNRKMNIFSNLSYGIPRDFTKMEDTRTFKDPSGNPLYSLHQNSFVKDNRHNFNVKFGTDYFLNKNTTLGFVFNGFINTLNETATNTALILNTGNKLDSTIYSRNTADGKFKNGAFNFNMAHHFDSTGRELDVDLDYIAYKSSNDQTFDNTTYLPDGNLSNVDILLGDLPRRIDIYSAKADYTHPLKKNINLELGAKYSLVKTNNDAQYYVKEGSSIKPDYGKTNTFLYNENINAAYASVSKEYKRWGLKLGMRAEQTNNHGHQLGNAITPDSSFSRNYLNVFPTAFFSFKLDSANNHQLQLSYNRRIDRPSYDQLNPFLSVAQRFYYVEGNPYLQPQFSNTVQLSYQYKWNFTSNIYYGYLQGAFNNVIDVNGEKYITRPGNTGSVGLLGFFFNGNTNIKKWWNLWAVFNPEYSHIKSIYNSTKVDTLFWVSSFNVGSQFTLQKGWALSFESNWGSAAFTGQYAYRARYGFGVGARKQIMKNNGTLSFRVNDIFYSSTARGKILNVSQTDDVFRNPTDSRVATISFSYRFGKETFERKRNDRDAAGDEKMRVRP